MLRNLGVLLLVAALVVGLAGVALASSSMTWKLDSEEGPASKEMERLGGPGDNGQTGSEIIPPETSTPWLSDETAQYDLTFSAASWDITLYRSNTTSDHDFTVAIGAWDPVNLTLDIKATSDTKTFTAGSDNINFNLDVPSFTVLTGNYVVFRISNPSGWLRIMTTGNSRVTYPADEPVYPVPELATIILLGSGLAALGGYLLIRGRTKSYSRA